MKGGSMPEKSKPWEDQTPSEIEESINSWLKPQNDQIQTPFQEEALKSYVSSVGKGDIEELADIIFRINQYGLIHYKDQVITLRSAMRALSTQYNLGQIEQENIAYMLKRYIRSAEENIMYSYYDFLPFNPNKADMRKEIEKVIEYIQDLINAGNNKINELDKDIDINEIWRHTEQMATAKSFIQAQIDAEEELDKKSELEQEVDIKHEKNIISPLFTLPMKSSLEVGGKGKPQPQEAATTGNTPEVIPPYVKLHNQIEQAGAYNLLSPERAKLLQTYLTTDSTMTDIKKAEGFKSVSGLHSNIYTSLERIWEHIPEDVRQEYGSAKDAIKTKSAHHSEFSRRRIKQRLDKLGRADVEKVEFKDTHKTHLSEAASRRWEREREARRAAQAEE